MSTAEAFAVVREAAFHTYEGWPTPDVTKHSDDCPGCIQDATLALIEQRLTALERVSDEMLVYLRELIDSEWGKQEPPYTGSFEKVNEFIDALDSGKENASKPHSCPCGYWGDEPCYGCPDGCKRRPALAALSGKEGG